MNPDIRRPRTLILPPLPYAIALFLGWWLHHNLVSLTWDWGSVTHLLGWLLITLGIILLGWTSITLWQHRTTVNPYKAVTHLCTNGPFHYSRNPIYVGDWLIFIGISVLLSTWWPLLFSPLIWVVLRYFVIRYEEAHLEAKFGSAYQNYQTQVRRWL